jgi:hypothetical protein
MKIRTLLAALALALSAPAMAATDLGVLDAGGSSFSRAFLRIFGFGSPLGAFVDHYTFTLLGSAIAEGGTTVAMEWGSLDLDLNSVSLSGGSVVGTLVDNTPASFTFSSLGAGTYNLDIAGVLKSVGGPLGYASYTGSIRSIASAAPEPAVLLMVLAGMAAVGVMVRRGRPG